EPPPPTPLTPRTPHESVTLHCQSPFSSHALAGHRLRCASSNSSLDSSTPLLLLLEGRPAEMRALTQAYFSAGTVRPAALLHRSKRGPEIERLHNLLRSHFFTRPASDHQLLSPPIPGWEEWRAEDLPGVLKLPVSVVIPSYARPHNLLALLPRLLPLEPLRAPCTLALVRHIDAIDLNARWFTAQRYHAAAGATNEVILHLDDDLLPGEATLQLLVG
ncbi:MAG: hypothetical protein SGPRY_014301, partial [Prymnesium sp.]